MATIKFEREFTTSAQPAAKELAQLGLSGWKCVRSEEMPTILDVAQVFMPDIRIGPFMESLHAATIAAKADEGLAQARRCCRDQSAFEVGQPV